MMRRVVVFLIGLVLLIPLSVSGQSDDNHPVATVRHESIPVAEFQKRVNLDYILTSHNIYSTVALYRQYGLTDDQTLSQLSAQTPYSTWISEIQTPALLGQKALDELTDEALIRQEAKQRNITVSEDDIQKSIYHYFGVDDVSTLTQQERKTTDQTAQDYFAYLEQQTGMTDSDIQDYFSTQALHSLMRDAVFPEQNNWLLFAHVHHISVATKDEAMQVMTRLQNHESFESLAQELSTDQNSAPNGGDLGWTNIYYFFKSFGDAVRVAPIGQFFGPIQTPLGYDIIKVIGREERQADLSTTGLAKDNYFQFWLDDLRTGAEDQIQISENWQDNLPALPQNTGLPADYPILNLQAISFSNIFKYPSGLFQIAVPSGWTSNPVVSSDNDYEVTFNNDTLSSLIKASLQKAVPAGITLDRIDALYTPDIMASNWSNSNHQTYHELNRQHSNNTLIINFNLQTDTGPILLGRQISWTDGTWVFSLSIVVPENENTLLNYLTDNLISTFHL